jgi:hypothetical protein
MDREDTLENCLLFLSQGHPDSNVEVNNDILRKQQVQLQDCPLAQLRGQIQAKAPSMLQQTAHVLERNQIGEIFLLKFAEGEHIFLYHF